MRRIVTVLALSAATAACRESTAPIGASTPLVSYAAAARASSQGSLVIRSSSGDMSLILNDDASSGLLAVMRTPTAPADLIPCGGTQDLDPANVKLVIHNSGRVNLQIKGRDVHVWIYDTDAFFEFPPAACAARWQRRILPLYEGFSDFSLHDSDAFFAGDHTDSFGFSANGDVTRASDGAPFSYHNEYHGVLAPDG